MGSVQLAGLPASSGLLPLRQDCKNCGPTSAGGFPSLNGDINFKELVGDLVEFGKENGLGDLRQAAFYEMHISVTRTILNATSGETNTQQFEFLMRGVSATYGQFGETAGTPESQGAEDLLGKLKEMFTPANTAKRITDFALSRFGQGKFAGENTEANRQAYAEYIVPAVEKGFNEAMEMLKGLPDEILGELNETMTRIKKLFEEFIRGSAPEEQVSQGLQPVSVPAERE